jgi:L,D-transpeptidase catalytic domain
MKTRTASLLSIRVSRRALLAGSAAAPFALTFAGALALDRFIDPATLKSGEFSWSPERSPEGPVVVLVSIPKQWVVVYRNGMEIGASTCSTGRPGHRTPAGVFVILEKDKTHHSSTYNNAPMPYMERLTWNGVALHAGNLPGYPASHGCVRLPLEFAKLLFAATTLGTPVIIAGDDVAAGDLQHPGLLMSNHLEQMAREAVKTVSAKSAHPATATRHTHEASSFVVSSVDRKLTAFVNGNESFTAPVSIQDPEKPFGTHAFALTGPDSDPAHLKWLAFGLSAGSNQAIASALLASETVERIDLAPDIAKRMTSLLHPGSTLVITDVHAAEEHRTGPGFAILTHEDV